MNIEQMEQRFYQLREQLNTGAISEAQFKAGVEKLQLRDAEGRHWMIGAQSGKWYYYDGQQWLPGDPRQAGPLSARTAAMCPQCGATVEAGTVFCGNCGYRLAATPAVPAAETVVGAPGVAPVAAKRSGGIPTWLWLGCGGLVIIGLLVAIVLVVAKGVPLLQRGKPTPIPAQAITPAPTPLYPLALQDDFSDPTSGWPTTDQPGYGLRYANGQYQILAKDKDLFAWSVYDRTFSDFSVEVEASKQSGPDNNFFGLMFRRQDRENFYRFDISSEGQYFLSKSVGGQWATLIDWTTSPHILTGEATNRLRVDCQGTKISLYVNGRHLADASDASFSQGAIGLFAGSTEENPNLVIAFDNFRVWAETGMAAGTPTTPPRATPEPGAPDVAQLLAQADEWVLQSRLDDAIAQYEHITELDPQNAVAYARWAKALYLDYRPEEAVDKALTATQLDPNSAEAYAQLARAYDANGEYDRAVEAARRAIELNADYADAHAFLAEAYAHTNRPDEATTEAQQAVALDDDSAEAHRSMGAILALANRLEPAIAEFQRAAQLQPNLWVRHSELADLLRRAEDYTAAIASYQTAIQLRPKAISYVGLGWAYLGRQQHEDALAQFNQAATLDPQLAAAYTGAGWAYVGMDQCDKAMPLFQQALSLNPDDREAQEGVSRCAAAPTPSPETPTPKPTPTTKVVVVVPTPEPVTPTPKPTPKPATTGRLIFPVFEQGQKSYAVYIANVDGSGRRALWGEASQPAASHDGGRVAFRSWKADERGLVIMDLSGANRLRLTNFLEDALPSFSPDGGKLVFPSRRVPDRLSRIYQVGTGGGNDWEMKAGGETVYGEAPEWMADGRIVYRHCERSGNCQGLYLMNGDGGGQVQLTSNPEDTAPSASPDSRTIAFMRKEGDGSWDIYVVPASGGTPQNLTNSFAVSDGLPAWSPDGRSIAFVSNQSGQWGIWAINADGSNQRHLFDVGGGGIDGVVASDIPNSRGWLEESIAWIP